MTKLFSQIILRIFDVTHTFNFRLSGIPLPHLPSEPLLKTRVTHKTFPFTGVKYIVTVITGDKLGAGTDADVYLQMFGELGNKFSPCIFTLNIGTLVIPEFICFRQFKPIPR